MTGIDESLFPRRYLQRSQRCREYGRGALRRALARAVVALPLLACSSDEGPGGRTQSGPAQPVGMPGPNTAGTGSPTLPNQFGNSQNTMPPSLGEPMVVPTDPGAECGAVTEMAQNTLQPADIIFGIDTSGSMAEEVAQVQQNLNAFSQQIIDSGIDVRVIVLATLQGMALFSGGAAVDGPCIAPPLGSGQCPNDSNPPTYVHIDTPVTSWDVLDVYINAYPSYREHLREGSLKTFVTISDDNADSETSPFAALGIRPTIHTAEDFMAAVDALEPGSAMWSNWRYSGIYSFTMCESAAFGAVGVVHEALVKATGGVAGDLCLQQFAPVFDELAQRVVEEASLACDWEIPASPQAGVFDRNKTNVQLTLDGTGEQLFKVPDVSSCGDREGWHYDQEGAPGRVVVCPATCGRIQAANAAQVDLLFGCQTLTVE